MTDEKLGQVVTFYSFKGGTGRTMALANVAWILASNGKRVLGVRLGERRGHVRGRRGLVRVHDRPAPTPLPSPPEVGRELRPSRTDPPGAVSRLGVRGSLRPQPPFPFFEIRCGSALLVAGLDDCAAEMMKAQPGLAVTRTESRGQC